MRKEAAWATASRILRRARFRLECGDRMSLAWHFPDMNAFLIRVSCLALALAGCDAASSDTDDGTMSGDSSGSSNSSTSSQDEAWQIHRSSLARDVSPTVSPELRESVRRANSRLAADLLLPSRQAGNSVASPYSLHVAFAQLALGAAGETATSLARELASTGSPEEIAAAYNAADATLVELDRNDDANIAFGSANALFADLTFTPSPTYLDALARHFGGAAYGVDYRNDSTGARELINDWVSENTGGKIVNFLSPALVNPTTNFHLINALQLTAPWSVPFDVQQTSKKSFACKGVQASCEVDTMHGNWSKMAAYNKSADGLESFELELSAYNLHFGVIMPPLGQLDSLVTRLATEDWHEVTGPLRLVTFDVYLPKFKIETPTLPLFDYFAVERNLESAFSGDFSPMIAPESAIRDFAITSVSHKAVFAIDELGVEAAAASSIGSDESANEDFASVAVD